MDLNLDGPAFPSATSSASHTSSHCTLSAGSALTTRHKVPNSSLMLFFLQKSHVQLVRFVSTDDKAKIRVRWEAARGDLIREWERRHRKAVKSQQRLGGEQVDECWPLSSVSTLWCSASFMLLEFSEMFHHTFSLIYQCTKADLYRKELKYFT
jgi:hypothetical protein